MRIVVGLVFLIACTSPDADDEPIDPVDPVDPPARIEVVLDHLEPGWRVTTSRLTGDQAPTETTVVSDGAPLSLVGTADDVFAAVVTDADGALVATHSMGGHCTMQSSRRRDVPGEYPTIQAAIDAAAPGDTVKVAPGTYTEFVRLKADVCLRGSGARVTTLEANGSWRSLVDLTQAPGSVVAGFTLRGVTGTVPESACGEHAFGCASDLYPSAIYVGGTEWHDPIQSAPPLIFDNVFEDNHTALLMYWRSTAIVRNNVFVANINGLVSFFFQSRALVANNVFYGNAGLAIVNHAAYLDLINNVIVGSRIGVLFENIQTGWIRCNVFHDNGAIEADVYLAPPRIAIGTDGNLDVEPLFVDAANRDFRLRPGSPGTDQGCYEDHAFDADGSRQDIGAYGGPLSTSVQL